MNRLKKIIISIFYAILLPLAPKWYAFTMWLTGKRGVEIKGYESEHQIAEALSWGRTWVSDPLGGVLDNMYHPTRVQFNMNLGRPVGDCDDHAVYWCAALLKSKLARKVWLSFYQYERVDGHVGGHVVCVFEKLGGGCYWVDYGIPAKIAKRSDWLITMEKKKIRRVLGAAEIPIERMKFDGTLVLGKAKKLYH